MIGNVISVFHKFEWDTIVSPIIFFQADNWSTIPYLKEAVDEIKSPSMFERLFEPLTEDKIGIFDLSEVGTSPYILNSDYVSKIWSNPDCNLRELLKGVRWVF